MAIERTGSELSRATGEGITLKQLESFLADLRWQPKWREEAARADDYYDGHQLTVDRLERMERLGIPPLVTNLVAPAINAVLGIEAKTRTDWRVTQADDVLDAPEEMMDAMNAKLNEAERESRTDRAISDSYAAEIKSGLGWVGVSRASDALAYPYRVQNIHRDEIWWDWHSEAPDLADARYLVRKKTFDKDVLLALMPEHAELIKFAIEDRFRTWQWDTNLNIDTGLAYAAHLERITNIDTLEWRNTERDRATLFEVWYRLWKRGQVLRLPNGRKIPFNKRDPKQVAAVSGGYLRPEEGVYSVVRVAFHLGPHRLYDAPSPYKHSHFPYVPFWGNREANSRVPYGMIRAMMSPQDVVNSSDSKMHWMLNSRRLRADSDAIDTKFNTWQQVRENLARHDSIVLLDPSKPNSRFEEGTDSGLNAQQFQRRMQAAADIENAGGIYRAMLGKDSSANSGVAISNLVEQGNITLAEINDNYQFARRQVGELLLSLVREDLIGPEKKVAVKKDGKRIVVALNKRVGPLEIENEVASMPTKVVLEDMPSTPAFRQQQLQLITQYTAKLPEQYQAAIIDIVMALTDVPQKDKVIERLRKIGGIPEDMTPEEEDAAKVAQKEAKQAQQDAIMRKEMAEIALLEAKIEELQNKVGKGESERLLKMVEAMYSALQAAAVVADNPGAAPVADEILKGAGFKDQAGQDPNIPQVSIPGAMPPQGEMLPEAPAQQAGMMRGIETARNDGAM